MNFAKRSNLVSCALAAVFFVIPVLLSFMYRVGFWSSTDNEPLGLASALNMAYRLADLRFYPDGGMADHPGLQFYFMSWLALALTGFPVATAGYEFFRTVMDHWIVTIERLSVSPHWWALSASTSSLERPSD
jgi:hypothetical protein